MTKAKIDEYLDWHHGAIRMGAGGYFFRAYFSGLMSKDGTWATQIAVDEAYHNMLGSMKKIEKIWLSDPEHPDKKFLFGDKPSIADLNLGCEMTNLMASDYDLSKEFPKIHKWMTVSMMSIPSFKKLHTQSLPRTKKFYEMIREKHKEDGVKLVARL